MYPFLYYPQETVFLVGACTEHFLIAAEMTEMKKKHKDGFFREVTIQEIGNFVGSGKRLTCSGLVFLYFGHHFEGLYFFFA